MGGWMATQHTCWIGGWWKEWLLCSLRHPLQAGVADRILSAQWMITSTLAFCSKSINFIRPQLILRGLSGTQAKKKEQELSTAMQFLFGVMLGLRTLYCQEKDCSVKNSVAHPRFFYCTPDYLSHCPRNCNSSTDTWLMAHKLNSWDLQNQPWSWYANSRPCDLPL